MATLCERTVFSFKGNSWKTSGLSALVAIIFAGTGASSGALTIPVSAFVLSSRDLKEKRLLTSTVYLPCS